MAIIDFEEHWDNARIYDIENNLLQGVLGCRTTESVEAAITYARYLGSVGITPENYPLFLKMLEVENHWVVDALIGERDPFLMFSPVQPNRYIVNRIFAMMTKWHKGGIYSKNLSVILGVLQSVYSSPKDGYRIYPLSIADLNALGKHLKKENGQEDPLNRVILEILDNLSELEGQGNSDTEEIAIHASSIRNAFFDNRKQMGDIIPQVLLVTVDDRIEISPRKVIRVTTEKQRENPLERKQTKTTSDQVVRAGKPKNEKDTQKVA
jgi:hypothetical protein